MRKEERLVLDCGTANCPGPKDLPACLNELRYFNRDVLVTVFGFPITAF
jgi:hypothetical protein